MKITGKKLFVKALKEEGVEEVFAYPGGMITDIMDEIHRNSDIRMILPRHEQALVHEAEGYARESGKVGVCLVTSGPGATNAVTAITDAYYDSIPLVVFTGQVSLNLIGNEAFQEVDIVGMTRGVTKYSVTVSRREDLGKILKMAFYIARTGRPGPVLIDLPKNIQNEVGDMDYPESVDIRGYKPNEGVHIGQLKKAYKLVKAAQRPLILAGGGINISGANDLLDEFSRKMHIPVVTTVMGKGALRVDHPFYVGNSGMHGRYAANKAVSECDVLFSIGTRFNDRITGDLNEFAPKAKIIHLDIDAASISRNVVVDVPIVADAVLALEKMLEWVEPKDTSHWYKQILKWEEEHPLQMNRDRGMNAQMIFEGFNRVYKEDTTYVCDVGQHQMWAYQYLDMTKGKRIFTSGGLGTMGFAFPAALGAKVASPNRQIVCVNGDGGFQMNMQEMATAMVYQIPITICLMNNHNLGMVRQFQTLFYGKRYSITDLTVAGGYNLFTGQENAQDDKTYYPDFIKWSESYGVPAIRVTTEEEIIPALEKAKAITDRPVVIEFIISEEELVLPVVKGGNPMSRMILE